MSKKTIRLFGVEFSPSNLNVTHKYSNGKTGYELGKIQAYTNPDQESFTQKDLIKALIIEPGSEASYTFEDEVKFGIFEAVSFIRDFISGFQQGRDFIDDARVLRHKFGYLCNQFNKTILTAKIEDHVIEDMANLGDLPILGFDIQPEKLTEYLRKYDICVVNGELVFVRPDGKYHQFTILDAVHLQEEHYKVITTLFYSLVEAMYAATEEQMYEDMVLHTQNRIREHVARVVETGIATRLPNFYLEK